MHKIHEKEFTMEDFSCEHLFAENDIDGMYYSTTAEEEFTASDVLKVIIEVLNNYREKYNETSKELENDMERDEMLRLQKLKKDYWWQMIQLLPSSYNQKRTLMLNYEVLANIYKSRRNHKLDEWHTFCDWIESLPYSELICGPEILRKEFNVGIDLARGDDMAATQVYIAQMKENTIRELNLKEGNDGDNR